MAEAITARRDATTAEMALAVSDDRQGVGLGATMPSEFRQRAAGSGLRTLLADVDLDNSAILAPLRSCYAVAASPRQLPALTLAVMTADPAPDRPLGDGDRILVEGAGWLTLSGPDALGLVARGSSVIDCPAVPPRRARRARQPDCLVLHGRSCRLLAHADWILGGFGEEAPTGAGVDQEAVDDATSGL